ncbi:hypothetical protein O181_112367 [Austropuccinia psidii MF-1]|uniref:Long chronological lifespan protein 2 n=1 Tax=Austropuccinia psidii MF-1 TaxID=1389203 RepID=A0A9Q3K1P9_9BASI|nr:hypothetical protein [Austropuccinia psidii MF-1]
MKLILILLIFNFFLIKLIKTQFNNIFEQLFNQGGNSNSHSRSHHHHHEDHHQDNENQNNFQKGSFNQFKKLNEITNCNQYLCPTTLACVSTPFDCPCSNEEDIKCPISDNNSKDSPNHFVCTRAPGCSRIEKSLKLGSSLS